MKKRRPHIVRELPPSAEAEARAVALEEHRGPDGVPDLEGLSLEEATEFLRGLMPGEVHGYHVGARPPAPTNAPPGSEEKLRVMRWRMLRGFDFHHPDDNKLPAGLFAPGHLTPEDDRG